MTARDDFETAVEDRPDAAQAHSTSADSRVKKRLAAPATPKKWSRTIVNFWLDFALLVNFLSLVWVATIIQFLFPPASAARGWLLWGYGIDTWMALQFALIAMLTFGILLHLMLHWNWVCGVFFSRVWRRKHSRAMPDEGTRTIYGVGLMIIVLNVLGLLIAVAALSIHSPI